MKSENVENIWIRKSKFKESKTSNDLRIWEKSKRNQEKNIKKDTN